MFPWGRKKACSPGTGTAVCMGEWRLVPAINRSTDPPVFLSPPTCVIPCIKKASPGAQDPTSLNPPSISEPCAYTPSFQLCQASQCNRAQPACWTSITSPTPITVPLLSAFTSLNPPSILLPHPTLVCRIPPYFALIIRAISTLEGIALVGNPDFAIGRYWGLSERVPSLLKISTCGWGNERLQLLSPSRASAWSGRDLHFTAWQCMLPANQMIGTRHSTCHSTFAQTL